MKTKKYYLILTIIVVFLCPSISVDAKHILADIDNLHVTIFHTGEEPNGIAWEKLKTEVSNRLNEAGMKVFSPEPGVLYKLPIWPELKIRVDMLKPEQLRQHVFHIQTLLAKNIYVEIEPALRQKADVWKTEPVMQAVSAESMPAKVTEVVLEQVDGFIAAWHAANPKDKQPSDANKISIVPKEQIKPAAKQAVAEYKYVASKNSKVFHKSDCTWAKRIAPKNLVHYKTREDAINDGKRPCKMCKP